MKAFAFYSSFALFALFLALFPCPQTVAAENSFAGTFANDKLTIKLVQKGERYEGQITMGKQSFPFWATGKAEVLIGDFRSENGAFDCTASLQGNILTFTTGDTTYKLAKVKTNPPAKPQIRVDPLNKTDGTSSVAKEKTGGAPDPANGPSPGPAWIKYQHPNGLSMSFPPDWEVRQLEQALQLVPPDSFSNDLGPTEVYFLTAEGANGITSAEDPDVVAYLDFRVIKYLQTQLLQVQPFMQRDGEVEKISAGSVAGILMHWVGFDINRPEIKAYAFATILKGYRLAIFALGDVKQIKAREQTLRGIFASFAAGEGQKDPQLVGTWKVRSYKGSSAGNAGTDESGFMTLQADGTCTWSSRSESSAIIKGRDSVGNQTAQAGVTGTGNDGYPGTWSAGEGKLFVMWPDGTMGKWAYRVKGVRGNRRLHLTSGKQTKPDEWVEAQ